VAGGRTERELKRAEASAFPRAKARAPVSGL